MPLTAASGAISRAENTAALTLADAAAFRTWTGAANQAEALTRIYFGALPPPAGGEEHSKAELTNRRPFALIFGRRGARRFKASGQRYTYTQEGVISVLLEQNTPAPTNDPQEAERRWNNTVGGIIDDVSELGGAGGYLALAGIDWDEPCRTHPDDVPLLGDAQQFWIHLDYGRQGK